MFEYENNYWWYKGLHELVIYFVQKYSNSDFSKNILDAGCGTGKMLELLSDYNFCEGFDLSEDAIKFSKSRNLKNVFLHDLNKWKSESNIYDFIISLDVICCKGIINENDILNTFYTSLKTGGKLILNLPALDILSRNHDIAVYIAKRYKRKTFVEQLTKLGFKINLATYRQPILFFIILILKIFEKKANDSTAISDLKPIPKYVNKLFLLNIRFENFFIRKGFRFPFGSSLFIVAEK